jgi:hypothetical protein
MNRNASSFRDRDGFVFEQDGRIRRQVGESYLPTYRRLKDSGFFAELWKKGWLIGHRELPPDPLGADELRLEPEQLPVITYPYEWSFGQLKDAALLTLQLQKSALAAG